MKANQEIGRMYRRTRLFGRVGVFFAGVAFVGIVLSAILKEYVYLSGAVLLLSFSFPGTVCFIAYAVKKEKSGYCFERDSLNRRGMLLLYLLWTLCIAGIVLCALTEWRCFFFVPFVFCPLIVTVIYRNCFHNPKNELVDKTAYYLETVLTPTFFVNGVDVYAEENREPTGMGVLLVVPDTKMPFTIAEAVLIHGKDTDFYIASVEVKEGVRALYLITLRDYARLCIAEGWDRHLAEDRKTNQRAFDEIDSPAFHEEGYFYTEERETRYHIIQEMGNFCVEEEELYWDKFFFPSSEHDMPYIWEVSDRRYFEYYKDAQNYIDERIRAMDEQKRATMETEDQREEKQ